MARVDIVIALYNKAACVGRAIRSIEQQTVTDWQLIVVDDGSTDNGGDIVRDIKDPRIELIRQDNQGPGAARNAGIARATSKYIAFLDADDEWYPWYLENALKAIENNDVALVATMYYEWPKKMDMTRHWAKRNVHLGKYSLTGTEDPQWADWVLSYMHTDTSLMYTEIARKYGGFYAENHCICAEDSVLFMRIGINESFLAIGPPAVRHHREASGLSHTVEHPLPPFLIDPEIILSYCPENKRELMVKIIDHMALRTAYARARNGFKDDAISLLNRFGGAKSYRLKYYQCLCTIALSRWLPIWVKFKCAVGPPVRLFLKSLAWKLGLIPKIPDIQPKTHTDGTDTPKISKKDLR